MRRLTRAGFGLISVEGLAWSALSFGMIATFGIAGCGSDDNPSEEETPREPDTQTNAITDGCDAIDLAPPEAGKGMQVSIDMMLEPGQERQVCKLVKVKKTFNLNWADGIYTHGSHHGLTARTNYRGDFPAQNIRGETITDPTQVATCEALTSDWDVTTVIGDGRPVGSEANWKSTAKGVLPNDVALRIEAGEILIVNFHMLNATEKPIHGCYKQNLYGIPDENVKQEAGHIFYYNPFITVPARQRATAKMACPVSHDIMLAAQVSHMHKDGVGYRAVLLDGDPLAGGKEIQELYNTIEWEEPIARVNTPALELKAGQWVQWQCDYVNNQDVNVAQGQETTDEMCMLQGTYWPRSDAMDFCMPDGSTDKFSAARPLTTGTMNGQQFYDCYLNSPQVFGGGGPASAADRYASQLCITQSCENVGARINQYGAEPGELDPTKINCE